jgi:hypothetical protein
MRIQTKHSLLVTAIAVSLVLASFVAGILTSAPAQTQIAKGAELVWEKTFGGTGDDRAFCAAKVPDGFLVAGSSTSFIQNQTVACAACLRANGDALWNFTFTMNAGAEFRSISVASDGFLLVGNSFLDSGCSEGLVVKLDNQGKLLWNVTLRAVEGLNKLFSAEKDGEDLITTGLVQPENSSCSSQGWIAKLDAKGIVIWSRTFGYTSETATRAVTITQDKCYIAVGYVNSEGEDKYDFLVLKLDAEGNMLWNKTFGGSQSDKAYAITSSGNKCVVVGDTRSKGAGDSDAWAIAVDLEGNLLWDTVFGGSNFDSPTCVLCLPNGGFLVAGTTFSFGNGMRDFWIFKLSDSGEVMWSCTVGRSGYEEAYAAICAGVSDCVLAGWTNSIGSGGRYDFYIVEVKLQTSELYY